MKPSVWITNVRPLGAASVDVQAVGGAIDVETVAHGIFGADFSR